MAATFVGKVYKHFEALEDYRASRISNHPLLEMVFLTLCATICDADSWADVERFGKAKLPWLRKYIALENGVPSHDTLGRVFARLDGTQFFAALQSWSAEMAGCLRGQGVALDGKSLRGSFDAAAQKTPLHTVSAWAGGLRMCIGLAAVDSKSNEIPAVQSLIDLLDLEGAVLTADAMHCQKETCERIVAGGAEYILFAKGNQPQLSGAIGELMLQLVDDELLRGRSRRHSTAERNRGREELRETIVIASPKDHEIFSQWPGIQSIGQVHRRREVDGKVQEETASFISTLPPKVKDLAKRVREHWSIENSQHHVLDVSFTEDASRIRKGSGPEISATFRRLALNILQRDTSMKDAIRGKRKRCGWDEAAFDRLIAQM